MTSLKPIPKILNPSFEETDDFGTFEYHPLPNGYGITLAVALRRVLLSSIPGCGIVSVAIEGVEHKFSTINGMKEDVLTFIENLKQIRFKLSDALNSTRVIIDFQRIIEDISFKNNQENNAQEELGLKYFTLNSSMIECPEGVTILNNVELCTCSYNCNLRCILSIKRGSGYVDHSLRQPISHDNFIPVRNILNSVLNCSYEIAKNIQYRDWNDYESLTIKVKTDGSIKPSQAIKKASSVLTSMLSSIGGFLDSEEAEDNMENIPASVLNTYILDIATFSKSTGSSLASFGIYTIGDLASYDEKHLLEMNGIGQKKLKDIKEMLSSFGINLKNRRDS